MERIADRGAVGQRHRGTEFAVSFGDEDGYRGDWSRVALRQLGKRGRIGLCRLMIDGSLLSVKVLD